MRYFKKIITAILIIICIFNNSSVFLVSASETSNDDPIVIVQEDMVDDPVVIVITETFSEIFGKELACDISENTLIDKVIYSYCFTCDENDNTTAGVELSFTMIINEEAYKIEVSGSVDAYYLSSGNILWEGPLSGTTTIDDTEYGVIAGFSKLDSNTDIQVSVTIQSEANDVEDGILIFTFGEDVVTVDIYEEVENNSSEYYGSIATSDVQTISSGYTWKSYNFATFGNNISGYSQRAAAYFNSTENRLAVTLKSYCSNVNDFYSSTGTAATTIRSFTIKLDMTGSVAYSKITGTVSFDFSESNYGAGEVYIIALFEDIMSLLGVSTSTITTILSGLKGSVTRSISSDSSYVTVTFGLLQSADFDDSGVGVPIVFDLADSSSNSSGTSEYTYTTSIRYRTVYVASGSTSASYIYIDGNDASGTVNLVIE